MLNIIYNNIYAKHDITASISSLKFNQLSDPSPSGSVIGICFLSWEYVLVKFVLFLSVWWVFILGLLWDCRLSWRGFPVFSYNCLLYNGLFWLVRSYLFENSVLSLFGLSWRFPNSNLSWHSCKISWFPGNLLK